MAKPINEYFCELITTCAYLEYQQLICIIAFKLYNTCLLIQIHQKKEQQINICCSKKFRFSKTIMQNKVGSEDIRKKN